MHQVVIVGGGVAGIDLATHLAGRRSGGTRLAVTLIDRESAHVWKPMLHTIAAGTRNVHLQQTPYVAHAAQHGFRYEPGAVEEVDRPGRTVRIAPIDMEGRELIPARERPYDTLILSVGSVANDFGTPGVDRHCYRIESRSDAVAFHEVMRHALIEALVGETALRVAIVGGGATGVEMAAEIVQFGEIAEAYGIPDARSRLQVTLIESGERILAAFPPRISALAQERLEELGVDVRTGDLVTEADAGGFVLKSGGRLEAGLKVWAAGVRAPGLAQRIDGLDRSRSGQIVVTPTLRSVSDPAIFSLGDCASLTLPGEERPLPPTAQAAFQEAKYLGRYLPEILEGRTVPDFAYRDFGALVSLGGYDAYGSLGKFGFYKGGFIRGRVAQIGHLLLYRRHQARIHGLWRAGLLWLSDLVAAGIRPRIRLD